MEKMVEIRYFAAVREQLGCERETLDLAEVEASDVGGIWRELVDRHPELDGLRDHVRLAKNGEFVGDDASIGPRDEIALIPPVAGGASSGAAPVEGTIDRYAISSDPLDREALRDTVARDEAGATVLFEGTVRDHTDDHKVERLEYECYEEMALSKLREVADEARRRKPDVSMAIHHRTGTLEVGETAVVVAASSPHRGPAFEACRFAIDRLKEVVPIWKKEVGPEGDHWVGWGP